MVNVKRLCVAVFAFGVMITTNAYAGLPTLDAGNMAASASIVKNGSENISFIDKINGKVSELNTIVGDGAASIAKFKADYGDDIQAGIEMGKKALARAQEAKAALEEHQAEVQEQKDAYQAAMDSLQSEDEAEEEVAEYEEAAEEETTEEEQRFQITSGEFSALQKEADKTSLMTSADKVYDDEEDASTTQAAPSQASPSLISDSADEIGEEFIDGVPDADAAAAETAVPMKVGGTITVSGTNTVKTMNATPATGINRAQTTSVSVAPTPASGVVRAVSGTVSQSEAVETNKLNTKTGTTSPTIQRRQFRVSPKLNRVDKVSTNTFRHSEKIAFASATSDSDNVGNSYVEDVYIVPYAQRCEISAQSFIDDENVRKKCIEQIIRENNASNSFDAALNMKDCQKIIYNTVVALLAEATQAKYEAANYSDTLDEQDQLAGDSTDVRGDMTVIAMSNQQTQLLLNRLSMSFSSQIILETAEQLCAMKSDVLGDSDLDEDSKTDGEK